MLNVKSFQRGCFILILFISGIGTSFKVLGASPTINVNDRGVYPVKRANETDKDRYNRWMKLNDLFQYAIKNKVNLYFPRGTYDVGSRNFPFRISENIKGNDLLDCSNIIISGENETILKTTSQNGADVLQLNKLKNITFRNFKITASVSRNNRSGSNGISITNGFDNITLENIYIYNLPGVDKGYWIDGGKGLTIQNSAGSNAYKGTIIARNVIVENCAYGFRMDTNHISDLMAFNKSFKLNIDIKVNKAFQGVSIEFGKALNKIPANALMNINVRASIKNCQQYVNLVRVIGGTFSFTCDRSQSYQQVLRDGQNKIWSSKDGRVLGLMSGYTKNTIITMTGNVGEVDNKIRIGVAGAVSEGFNLRNRTENNRFNFNLAGNSKKGDINIISFRGESLNDNEITISKTTAQNLPREMLSNKNRIIR